MSRFRLPIFFASIFLCLAGFVLWQGQRPVQAAPLTSLSDIMTRQKVSTASNHELRFTTPTGIDQSTDTISLTFSSGFDLSSVVFGDIDLFHGAGTGLETSETLAAAVGAGVWGVSVSGQVVTFTAPTDAAVGEISAGQKIVIRIGTGAVGGTHQITNSSTAGDAVISIGGTFGDAGGVTVPIVSHDSIAVTATVPAQGGGVPGPGGGPGGPGQQIDGTPPVISHVQAQNVTANSATITWQTDENADSLVKYGQDGSYASGTVTNGAFTAVHSLNLVSLGSDTNYHFKVTSKDQAGNAASSGDVVFHTAAPVQAPIISNIQVSLITDHSVIITWDTNSDSSSLVEYGLTNGYGSNASSPGNVHNHSVSVSGLSPDRLYHFRVTSKASGLSTVSVDQTFTTAKDLTPPANVFGFQATAGDAKVTLSWTNPPDADFAQVIIRARTDHFPVNVNDGRNVYQGSGASVIDNGLINGVNYFYGNFSVDTQGNKASGAFAQAVPVGNPKNPQPEPEPEPQPKPQPQPAPQNDKNQGGHEQNTQFIVPGVSGGNATTTATSTKPLPIVSQGTSTVPLLPAQAIALTPEFYAHDGAIQLQANLSGRLSAFAGQGIFLRLSVIGLPALVTGGSVRIGSALYALAPSLAGDAWIVTFVPALIPSDVSVSIVLEFSDKTFGSAERIIRVFPLGRVVEDTLLGLSDQPISAASVNLFERHGGELTLWNGKRFGQANPVASAKDGSYGFLVPNGSYRLQISKTGYSTSTRDIEVSDNVVGFLMGLKKNPKSFREVINPSAPLAQNVRAVAEEAGRVVNQALEAVRTPENQAIAQTIVAPTVVTIAAANVATAVNSFQALNYVRFLLTQPFLFFWRRKRQKWGTVYDALTKRPVELAIVRLIHAERNIILQTKITNAQGQFSFSVRPGTYRLQAVKPGFTFPSTYLKGQKQDIDFLDLYHGELVEVKSDTPMSLNIPIDPLIHEETPKRIVFKKSLLVIRQVMALSSVVLSVAALIVAPSIVMGIVLLGQTGMYVLFRRLAIPAKPKNWGIIYDATTRQPVERAIVRIFHKKFNKLLETQMTDKNGKYGFFAGKGVFYVTAEGQGYSKYQSSDFDLSQKVSAVIDQNIPLNKG
ncbi:hypothetical protein EXS71_02350 [Candidatus Uhrbacteria bacterium]|nr:hypothetical protein [Candidatus Uhrbacteria bacterium]